MPTGPGGPGGGGGTVTKPVLPATIRAGWVAPCLAEGGGENYMLFLVDALAAYPPRSPVQWQGCCVLDSPSNTSAKMLGLMQAAMPVSFGESGLQPLASECDLLISWAVYPYGILSPMPPLIFVDHRTEAWGPSTAAWLANALAFVAVSPSAAATIPSSFSAITTTILNAIDPARLAVGTSRAAKRSAWGVPAGAPVVGAILRFEAEKDPDALRRLALALPSGSYVVGIGDGSLRAGLQSAGVANLVLPGPDSDVGGCLAAFDSLLIPDLVDSYGYTIAQGWYSGVPVISTPVGVAAGEPGLVRSIPTNADGSTLAAAVAADAADPSGTSSRVAAAQSYARSNFGMDRFGPAWATVVSGLYA